jgi:hypothetical protein
MTRSLEDRFTRHLSELVRRTTDETGYNPTLFQQMLHERQGVGTARALLNSNKPSSGFTTLWEKGRLDLTLEAIVIQEPWAALFTSSELATARKRLKDLGYKL